MKKNNTAVSDQDIIIAKALKDLEIGISEINPHPKEDGEAAWQERKSAQTRIALLQATVECLSKSGYARTTTKLVAETAKISRGAMLHHYATKLDLIVGVTDYILFRRMEILYTGFRKLTEKQRVDETQGLEILWNSIQTPEHTAYMELMVASRTDSELDKIFYKRAKMYDDISLEQLPAFFPEWAEVPKERLRLASDLLNVALEGLQANRRILANRQRRVAIRDLLKDVIKLIRESS